MIILPAIDILDQQPVRLYQGDYEQKECVGDSIGDIAKAFEQQGARYVHMVDLNGAKEGKKINQDIIVKTAQSLQILSGAWHCACYSGNGSHRESGVFAGSTRTI